MFASRYLNNALNNIHERALRLIHNDHEKSFNSILAENNIKAIHQKNFRFLAIEIQKFQNGWSPPKMKDIFLARKNVYYLLKRPTIVEIDPWQRKIGTNFRTVQEEDKKIGMWTLSM